MALHPGVQQQIDAAVARLAKDKNAPKTITIDISPYNAAQFPKHVYKGKGTANFRVVNNDKELSAATTAGYGKFSPEVAEDAEPIPAPKPEVQPTKPEPTKPAA